MSQTRARRDDGIQFGFVVALDLCRVDFGDVRLYGHPCLLHNADKGEAERHVGKVLIGGTVLAHALVGFVGIAPVAARVEMVAQVFVAHLHEISMYLYFDFLATHTYALLYEVVLVGLQLVLQLVRLAI